MEAPAEELLVCLSRGAMVKLSRWLRETGEGFFPLLSSDLLGWRDSPALGNWWGGNLPIDTSRTFTCMCMVKVISIVDLKRS